MGRIFGCLVFLLVVLLTTEATGYTERDCIRCHGQKGSEAGQYIDMDAYRASVHGSVMSCMDCHQSIRDNKHIKVKNSGKVNCQVCHEQKNLHAQNGKVKCSDCHTPHLIYRVDDKRSSVYWKNFRVTCGRCHPAETRQAGPLAALTSFRVTSHSKQDFARTYDIGMCTGCHQGRAVHGESVPVNDQDCYKCHMPLAQKRFYLGYMHANSNRHNKPIKTVVDYIYLAIALVIGVLIVREFVSLVKKLMQ